MAQSKWTFERRKQVYSTLLDKFGAHELWGKHDYPEGRKEEYEAVLQEIAKNLTEATGKQFKWTAVRQQVRWGISLTSRLIDTSVARSFVVNKAVAIEVGFVSFNSLQALVDALAVDADE